VSNTQNTSISRSKLGQPRFDHNPEDALPGELIEYKLSKEELAEIHEKLGPPNSKRVKNEKRRAENRAKNKASMDNGKFQLTKEYLDECFYEKGWTIAQVAGKTGRQVKIVQLMAEKLGFTDVPLNAVERKKNREADNMAQKSILETLREKFPKETFAELYANDDGTNKSIKEMAKIMDCPAWAVSHLKKEYSLTTDAKVKAQKTQEAEPKVKPEPKDEPNPEPIIAKEEGRKEALAPEGCGDCAKLEELLKRVEVLEKTFQPDSDDFLKLEVGEIRSASHDIIELSKFISSKTPLELDGLMGISEAKESGEISSEQESLALALDVITSFLFDESFVSIEKRAEELNNHLLDTRKYALNHRHKGFFGFSGKGEM